jgi:hypothetical protein
LRAKLTNINLYLKKINIIASFIIKQVISMNIQAVSKNNYIYKGS